MPLKNFCWLCESFWNTDLKHDNEKILYLKQAICFTTFLQNQIKKPARFSVLLTQRNQSCFNTYWVNYQ